MSSRRDGVGRTPFIIVGGEIRHGKGASQAEQVLHRDPVPGGEKRARARRPLASRPRFLVILAVVACVFFASVLVVGWSYYTTPVQDRIFHPHHGILRPSGRLGLLAGVIGTWLMALNLTYLMRKRILWVRWLGPLKGWMDFHVLTGLVGPALILLHSAFAPYSALGTLSFAAMLIAVATGTVGRYIYARVPRSIEGHELEFDEVRKRLLAYQERLSEVGVSLAPVELDVGTVSETRPAGFLRSLAAVLRGGRDSRREYRELRSAVCSRRELVPYRRRILPLLRKLCRERQWLLRYQELRSLMGHWRFFHRWLAVVMLLVVLFHIALAAKFGDLWILRR